MSGLAPARRRDLDSVAVALTAWLRLRLAPGTVTVENLSRPAGAGLSNETYFFDCVLGGARQALVLQVGPAGTGLFRDYDLEVMARVQQQLARVSSVPTANVRWYEGDSSILGAPFYVMDRVAGRVPTDNPSYHAGGWFAELPHAELTAAWFSGIDALARLHALDPLAAGCGFLTAAPWGMALDADPATVRLAQWRDFLAWGAPTPLAVIEQALAALEHTRPQGRLGISWGDAKISNCVIDGGQVVALLDWELCGLSDPEEDLAFWLVLDWAQWASLGGTRLAQLPSVADTIAHYEAASGHRTHALTWWFRFGLVRLAIIYNRFLVRRREVGRLGQAADLAALNPMMALIPRLFSMKGLP